MSLTDAGHRPGSETLGRGLRKRPDRRRGWACGPKHDPNGEPLRKARSSPSRTAVPHPRNGNIEISIALVALPCPTSRGFLHRRLSDAGPPRASRRARDRAGIRNPSRFLPLAEASRSAPLLHKPTKRRPERRAIGWLSWSISRFPPSPRSSLSVSTA
jgi:hypothetical protein